VLDSGCTQHMTGDSRMFNSINENDSIGVDSIVGSLVSLGVPIGG
jgi:hypothetical protein